MWGALETPGHRSAEHTHMHIYNVDRCQKRTFHSVLNGCEQSISVFLSRFLSRLKVFLSV